VSAWGEGEDQRPRRQREGGARRGSAQAGQSQGSGEGCERGVRWRAGGCLCVAPVSGRRAGASPRGVLFGGAPRRPLYPPSRPRPRRAAGAPGRDAMKPFSRSYHPAPVALGCGARPMAIAGTRAHARTPPPALSPAAPARRRGPGPGRRRAGPHRAAKAAAAAGRPTARRPKAPCRAPARP
jgi:hypothetical protein